jgi:hypothetical protein
MFHKNVCFKLFESTSSILSQCEWIQKNAMWFRKYNYNMSIQWIFQPINIQCALFQPCVSLQEVST